MPATQKPDAQKPAATIDSAEKAYAAAAETVVAVPATAPATAPAPVAVAEPSIVIPALKTAKVAAKPVSAKPVTAKAAPKAKKPAAKPVVKIAPKPAAKVVAKPAAKHAVKKIAKIQITKNPITKIKETIMPAAKTKTTDFTAKVKTTIADVQTKAKAAYAKGTAVAAEAGAFTKGNVEAVAVSGKILAEGMKGFGTTYAAEGKKAYETMTADAKALVAVKSPTEFFELQTKLLRRNFDSAVALTSKNTEAAVKLAGDAFAPLSTRVSLAVEAFKKAA